MTDKPSYLGLLNAIANAEGDAFKYFTAWAGATDDAEVEQVVRTVAIREGEHALSFEKRIRELGFALRRREDPNFETKMATLSRRDVSDLEKFRCLGFRPGEQREDPFGKFLEDPTMDIGTSALMGRYVGEERDSTRLLMGCVNALAAAEGRREGNGRDGRPTLDDVCAEIGELKAAIAELQETVAALAPAPAKKGGKREAASH